jgi:uncharacterized protein (TIGR03067 family)
MKSTLAILAFLLGATSGVAQETGARAGDLGRLQGRWAATTGARREIRVELEIKGRSVCVAIHTPQGPDFQVRGELKLDETTTPRSLDWLKFSGPDQRPLPEIAAVYKLEGDAFTVCNGGFLGSRPKEFKPGEGPLADVVVFRRLESSSAKSDSMSAMGSHGTSIVLSGLLTSAISKASRYKW